MSLLFYPAHIVPASKIAALIGVHKLLQRVRADDHLSSDLQYRQLAPLHQLPHRAPPDSRNLGGLINGHAQFYNADCPHPLSFVAICNLAVCIILVAIPLVKPILQLILEN